MHISDYSNPSVMQVSRAPDRGTPHHTKFSNRKPLPQRIPGCTALTWNLDALFEQHTESQSEALRCLDFSRHASHTASSSDSLQQVRATGLGYYTYGGNFRVDFHKEYPTNSAVYIFIYLYIHTCTYMYRYISNIYTSCLCCTDRS